MREETVRHSFISMCLVFSLCGVVAGCGGGSGNGGNGGGGGGGENPTTVTLKVTAATPAAVATQIGTGSFTAATITSGALTLSVPFGTSNFAVAYACPATTTNLSGTVYSSVTENVLEASTADGMSFNLSCAEASNPANPGILTGSVDATAIAGADYVGVMAGSGGSSFGYFLSGTTKNFSESVPAGSDRVAVEAFVYSAANQYGAYSVWTLAAVRGFTGVTVPGSVNGGSTVVLGAADAVTMQPITYSNVPSGYGAPTTIASYGWSGGGGEWLSNGATNQYPAVPAAAVQSGDFYEFISSVESTSGLPAQRVTVDTWTTSGGPLAVNFPAAWPYTGPTPAALPVFSMAYSGFSGSKNVYDGASINWQSSQTSNVIRNVDVTANHLGGSTSLAIPDLSALTGFAAPPASGTLVVWSAEIGETSFPVLQTNPGNGTASIVETVGTYNTP